MAKLPLPKSYSADFQNPRVKPVGDVEIDWDNPITRGLKFWPVFVGNKAIDLVSGQTGVNAGTITGGVSKEGKTLISGGTSQVAFSDVYHGIGTGAFTQLVRFNWDGNPANFQTPISLPTVNEVGMYTPQEAGGAFSSDADASGTIAYSPDKVIQDQFDTFSICKGDGSSIQDGFVNGILQSGGLARNYTEGGTSGITLFNGQGSEYGHGGLLFAAVWNRRLTDSEQLEMARTPYQILKPKVEPVYWTVGGAIPGGDTIIIDAGSYTVTGTDVNPLVNFNLTTESGSYATIGTALNTPIAFNIDIESDSYEVTGTDLNILKSTLITLDSGAYSVTGTDVLIGLALNMTLDAGSYIMTGTDITITVTGDSIWTDKISVSTSWGDKTPITTTWTDKG